MDLQQDLRMRQATTNLVFDAMSDQGQAWEPRDLDEYLRAVTLAEVVSDEARTALARWVAAARRAGASWSDIGTRLGISKQAAQQRFGKPDGGNALEDGETIRLGGANAFNEMAMLAAEGDKGHELVATNILSLTFRKTDRQWEYRRVSGAAGRKLEAEGWTLASTWFPFRYYKRAAAQ
jgi:hypothetical protein